MMIRLPADIDGLRDYFASKPAEVSIFDRNTSVWHGGSGLRFEAHDFSSFDLVEFSHVAHRIGLPVASLPAANRFRRVVLRADVSSDTTELKTSLCGTRITRSYPSYDVHSNVRIRSEPRFAFVSCSTRSRWRSLNGVLRA